MLFNKFIISLHQQIIKTMKHLIDNLEKLRLQFLGLANQTGNTGYSKIEQQMIKDIKSLSAYWEEIKAQDILFKKLLNLKEFNSELSEYFEDCLKDETGRFEYYHEDIDFIFYDIQGYVTFDRGDWETPPTIDMEVSGYEVMANFYDEETDKYFENITIDGALLELLKIKLNFDE